MRNDMLAEYIADFIHKIDKQIIGNFFGGTTSIGIGLYEELDTDNTNEEAYGFRINLGSKTAYRISVNRTFPGEGTYEYYTISSDGWVSSSISKVAEN